MTDQMTLGKVRMLADLNLIKLTPENIKQIDELLSEIGLYGQVQIVVENGELRYINKLESHKARNRDEDK
jgi:hypothetical protein